VPVWHLILACGRDEFEVARALLDHGANVNASGVSYATSSSKFQEAGTTPILAACSVGSTNIVELLLSRGAKVDSDSEILGLAIERRNTEIIRMLLSHGAQVLERHIRIAMYYRVTPEILEILREAQAKQSPEKKGGGSRRTYRNKKRRTGRTKKRSS